MKTVIKTGMGLTRILTVFTVFMLVLVFGANIFAENKSGEKATPFDYDYFKLREGLKNSRVKFEVEKKGRVVFFSGTITQYSGFRALVETDLKKRFPNTKFDFVSSGAYGIGTRYSPFRFTRDLLKDGPVDLLFVDAAFDAYFVRYTPEECILGMEGVVRQARILNPNMDIIMMHIGGEEFTSEINSGKIPFPIEAHESVAEYYGVASLDLAKEVADRINAKEFTWKKDLLSIHLSQFGQELYAKAMGRLFDAAWKKPLSAGAGLSPYKFPEKPLNENSYFKGKIVNIKEVLPGEGFSFVENWKVGDKKGTIVEGPFLFSEKSGSTFKLKFEGTAVGVLAATSPDGGTIEFSIDGAASASLLTFYTGWNGRFQAFVLKSGLVQGKHELVVKVSEKAGKNFLEKKGNGSVVRIKEFLVN